MQAVNTTLIELCWQIGQTISHKAQLPDTALLQAKLHELYAQNAATDPVENNTAS